MRPSLGFPIADAAVLRAWMTARLWAHLMRAGVTRRLRRHLLLVASSFGGAVVLMVLFGTWLFGWFAGPAPPVAK